jgi:hypothetical protein
LRADRLNIQSNNDQKMAQSRIYIVGTPNGLRLIRAAVRQQALTHAANSMFTVRVASQDDLVNALSDGVKIENYKAPDQPDLELE